DHREGGGALQRFEERDDLVLLGRGQRVVVVSDEGRFAGVPLNRSVEGQRGAVVHVAIVRPHAPQRLGAQLVARRGSAVLDDAVAGADVVQQEVAVRVDDLVAERRGNRQRAPVDAGAHRRGRDRRDVTDGAADRVEQVGASDRAGGGGQGRVAR